MSFFRKAGSDSESSSESEEELLQSSDDESGSDVPKAKPAKPAAASSASKPKGASKFLKGAGSSSDDDSDDDDSESSDEEESDLSDEDGADGAAAGPKKKAMASKFLRSGKGGASDSSSDEDEDESDEETVKIVKSAKTKRMDEMEAIEKSIMNAERIGDWGNVNSEYDKLGRLAAPLPGSTSSMLPPVFLRVMLHLEESLASASTAGAGGKKTKMNATAAKALTAIKQKIKKAIRENEELLSSYKEDKDAYSKKYEGGPVVPTAAPKRAKKVGGLQEGGAAADDEFMTVGKGGKAVAFGSSAEGVFKNLQIILEARGRKNTDRSEQLKALNRLYVEQCPTVYAKIRVLLALVSSYFDYAAANAGATATGGFGSGGYMPLDVWAQARAQLNELLEILIANRDAYLVEEVVKQEYDDLEERAPNQNGEGPVVHIRGNVVSLVERLDDEFHKSLQNLDPHASEYVDRLRDEKLVYDTLVRSIKHFELTPEQGGKGPDGETPLGRVLLRRLEHIYSKPDLVVASLESSLTEGLSTQLAPQQATAATAPTLTRTICIFLYKHAASRVRTRALLCHIYHAALHDDYYTARNMFNMSNVQSDVPYAEVETQGLFNRTLVQLGLCAFRVGLIEESEQTLREIIQTQRVKELLFQGIPTFSSRHTNLFLTPEQEKIERSRQLPFHMHINLDLLECVYLTAAMLVEIPQLAKEESNPELRKQVSSRTFRRMLDLSQRQAFTGPPENKRDHVIQGSKALMASDWRRCTELITTIKVWNLMPNEAKIKEMLGRKIQEVALRTYLFTSARHYTNLSMDHLASTLALPTEFVTPVVSRMIWEEELSGSLDQSSSMLSLQRVERTALQQQATDLLERAENMVRLLGHTRPGFGDDNKDSGAGAADGQQGRRGGGERRRGGGYRGGRGRGGSSQFAGPIRAM